MTQEDVAKTVGRSRSSVANAMRLLALPDEVLEMLENASLRSVTERLCLHLTMKKKCLKLPKSSSGTDKRKIIGKNGK